MLPGSVLPRGGAAPVTCDQHRGGGGPHACGQGGLHPARGWPAEDVRDVADLAGQALHMLAGLVQRDDRDEEQGEEAPPGAVPVVPVTTALRTVEGSFPDGVVEDPKSPDEQQRSSLPVVPAQ